MKFIKVLVSSVILVVVMVFVPFDRESAHAQTPVLLDNNLEQEGVTIPVPAETVQQVDSVQSTVPAGTPAQTNYYPDERLPRSETFILLVTGLLFMTIGTLLVTNNWRLQLFPQRRKKDLLIMSKHFGHNV